MKNNLLTLIMLCSATASASDTYDPASGILSIPSVIVGNTTFNNVVIKQQQFSVLSHDPKPLVGQSTAYTSDTYDPASALLSIPSVMVGNTTYSNVSIKEQQFKVLSYDPNPLVGQTLAGALYNYTGCYYTGAISTLVCNMTLTSPNQSLTLPYDLRSFQLIDDKGHPYTPNAMHIANQTGDSMAVTLAANVVTPMQLTFTNIAPDATAVVSLNLTFGSTIAFKNQPFISGTRPRPL